MASIKNLKKDINFLASEIVTEAYVKQLLNDSVDADRIAEVMVDAITFRNEFVAQANHPDGKDNSKIVKAYYKNVQKKMFERFLKITEKINEL